MGKRNAVSGNARTPLPKPIKFPLGKIIITPGAATEIDSDEITAALRRHPGGDWGNLDPRERNCNEKALKAAGWLLSSYVDPVGGERFLVITQPNRTVTTVMIPNEFGEM